MIALNFQTNDTEKLKYITYILVSKFEYTFDPQSIFLCKFEFVENELKLFFMNHKTQTLSLPLSLSSLLSFFENINNSISFELSSLKFFPYKSEICNSEKKLILTDIHKNILCLLITNKEGVDKVDLYKRIWPSDKQIIINKLDTHLTNIKNIMANIFGITPTIVSKNKKIFID